MESDGYLRGENAGAENDAVARSPIVAPYRSLVGLIWAVGVPLLLLAPFAGAQGVVAVYVVTHVFLAGFVRWDLLALRRQGLDFGFARHFWFAATLVLPLVAPAYYLYAGRRIDRENERRERRNERLDVGQPGADDESASPPPSAPDAE
ncbi:hypothetical protein ACFO0N_13455 [Halobium salinum]|uniref:Uncharacterized protein n=1 Tax=Halobium salinum TaxID=1364940 RepID=A0ABD5PDW4_9EURY|nr:hypothetical protein [Halobium salinum]